MLLLWSQPGQPPQSSPWQPFDFPLPPPKLRFFTRGPQILRSWLPCSCTPTYQDASGRCQCNCPSVASGRSLSSDGSSQRGRRKRRQSMMSRKSMNSGREDRNGLPQMAAINAANLMGHQELRAEPKNLWLHQLQDGEGRKRRKRRVKEGINIGLNIKL